MDHRAVVMTFRARKTHRVTKYHRRRQPWLHGIKLEEDPEVVPANEGGGALAHDPRACASYIWDHGEIPPRNLWVIVILISKGGGDYHGIGLLEPMLKVFEQSMDHQLKAFELHNSLHGCHNGCGTGTAGIEAKLTQ